MLRLTVSTRKTEYMKLHKIGSTVHIYVRACSAKSRQSCFAPISGRQVTILKITQEQEFTKPDGTTYRKVGENVGEDRISRGLPKASIVIGARPGSSTNTISVEDAANALEVLGCR